MSLPGWVPKNYLEKVQAIYDYNADKEDELTFQGWKLLSCSHCQELGKQASWLLIGAKQE